MAQLLHQLFSGMDSSQLAAQSRHFRLNMLEATTLLLQELVPGIGQKELSLERLLTTRVWLGGRRGRNGLDGLGRRSGRHSCGLGWRGGGDLGRRGDDLLPSLQREWPG
jgi:hypothetical protein